MTDRLAEIEKRKQRTTYMFGSRRLATEIVMDESDYDWLVARAGELAAHEASRLAMQDESYAETVVPIVLQLGAIETWVRRRAVKWGNEDAEIRRWNWLIARVRELEAQAALWLEVQEGLVKKADACCEHVAQVLGENEALEAQAALDAAVREVAREVVDWYNLVDLVNRVKILKAALTAREAADKED